MFANLASAGSLAGNPDMSLSVLEHRGAAVRSLGTRSIDGVDCLGFDVTPSEQALGAVLPRGLPPVIEAVV